MLLALINILQDDSDFIRPVSRSTGTQIFVLLGPDLWTLFAVVAPGVADAAAASGLRDRGGHVENALRPSGAVFETREAERFSLVYRIRIRTALITVAMERRNLRQRDHQSRLTDASVPGLHQLVIRRTLADVLALSVYASTILAGLRVLALVDVGAVSAGAVELVAFVALAAEHPEGVLAAAEDAQVAEQLALVYVYAGLLVVLGRVYEAYLALAAEGAGIVEAVAIFAEGVVVRAFVDVSAGVAVAAEAGVADALQ